SPRTELWESFLSRYFPSPPSEQQPLAQAKDDSRTVTGEYIFSRRSETSFLKLLSLVQEPSVSAKDDGTVEIDAFTGLNGKPKKWQEIAPMVFHEVDGEDNLVFKPAPNGGMELVPSFPIIVGQRAGAWENQNLLLAILAIALLVMLLTLFLWPIGALVRRHYGRKLELTKGERRLRVAVRLVCALDVAFLAALTALMIYGFGHIWILNGRLDKWIHLIQIIGLIGAAGTLILVYNAIHSWLAGPKGIFRKLGATLLALAGIGLLLVAIVGHLLNFNVHY